MPNYKRFVVPGCTYFFTQVTYQRYPWLCTENARQILRVSINKVRQTYPFKIEALVLLPDHLHCIWTLPPEDSNYATRWRMIKTFVSKNYVNKLPSDLKITTSREKRKESNLWQRRFWEHLIRDENDFINHCNYIHFNPVKHGLCQTPTEWEFSSIHRFIAQGLYPKNWGNYNPHTPYRMMR
ncbi:MAG: transposase [Cyanobacteria bacterium J06639_18]